MNPRRRAMEWWRTYSRLVRIGDVLVAVAVIAAAVIAIDGGGVSWWLFLSGLVAPWGGRFVRSRIDRVPADRAPLTDWIIRRRRVSASSRSDS